MASQAAASGAKAPEIGEPKADGEKIALATTPSIKPDDALAKAALAKAAGIKRRSTGNQSNKAGSKAKSKAPNTGGSEMSDVAGEEDDDLEV